ncbi:MAG: EamA family transporter [Planctomycetaceae bacterium]
MSDLASAGAAPETEPERPKGSERTMIIGLILISVLIAGVAQVTLKVGVNRVTDAHGGTLQLSAGSLKELLTSWVVWAGLVLFALSAVTWLFALSRVSLSYAYPFAALGYVLILVFSILVLHEHVSALRWLGVACIVTGIVLVAQTPHA